MRIWTTGRLDPLRGCKRCLTHQRFALIEGKR